MHTLDCNALKIHNYVIKEWKGTHKVGIAVLGGEIIGDLKTIPPNVMLLCSLKYKMNT